MTDDRRSLERAARSWLEAGPTEAPTHAVEAALLRIQLTPQERDFHVPRRFLIMPAPFRVAAAAVIGVLALGGVLLLTRPAPSGPGVTQTPSLVPSLAPSVSTTASGSITPSVQPVALDYSAMPGRILIEHAGNAPDLSEPANGDYHIDRRRFYWMRPSSMIGSDAVEFLPGQPKTGKVTGDVSRDQTKIVFMDGDPNGERLWLANLDGTGLKAVPKPCGAATQCAVTAPSFDPTGTKIAFIRRTDAGTAVVVRDLASGQDTVLQSTSTTGDDNGADRPVWSPDGTKIAFCRMSWNGDVPKKGTVSVTTIATDRTTLLPIALQYPGDPHWSADGSRLLVTDGPLSMAAVPMGGAGRTAETYDVATDGTDLRQLTHTGGEVVTANYTPDGHILFFYNYFWLADADGSHARPVNVNGSDLSEMEVGFSYVGHWIDTP